MGFVNISQTPTFTSIFSEKHSERFLLPWTTLGKRCNNGKIPEQDFLLFELRAGLTETKYRGSASVNEESINYYRSTTH